MRYVIKRMVTAVILTIMALPSNAQISQENEALLAQLDEMLSKSETYYEQRAARIQELRIEAQKTTNPEERFWKERSIFLEYSIFDSDSAMACGHRAIKMAEQLQRPDLVNELHITLSYILAGVGMLDESGEELKQVDEEALSTDAHVEYLEQKLYLITHQMLYDNASNGGTFISKNAQAVLDSIISQIRPTHPNYHFYLAYQSKSDERLARKAINVIEPHIKLTFDTPRDAKLTWAMSQLYLKVGDDENRLRCLILSAMTDLRIGNREIASLEELAGVMEEYGDLLRAYNYISHCIKCAELYKNRVRALRIASLQREISQEYQTRLIVLQDKTTFYLYLTGGLAVVLVLALLYIYRQHRRMAHKNLKLTDANDEAMKHMRELTDAYAKLASKNEDLLQMSNQQTLANEQWSKKESNYITALANTIIECSAQIGRHDERRLQLSRLLKTNMLEQARRQAESPETVQADIKEFHALFDNVFLGLYPNFVSDFNALLQPEEAIIPKEEGRLNTELRIYALIFLGITDSVTIASVLHCSVQTVYNKRMKTRNKAQEQKDNLVEQVQSLHHLKVY